MFNLYGGQGMGTGAGGMNPNGQMGLQQLMAMMQAGNATGATPGPNVASPMAPGGVPTPMSNYIGAPAAAGMAQHPMPGMPPNGAPPAVDPGQAAQGGLQSMMPLLAMMKGGQGGVSPGSGSANWLQNLLAGYSAGGVPGQGVMNGLSGQAAGNVANGAAGL